MTMFLTRWVVSHGDMVHMQFPLISGEGSAAEDGKSVQYEHFPPSGGRPHAEGAESGPHYPPGPSAGH